MAVTIYEIAERAQVSSSTVARVLRGDVKESHRRSAENAARIRRIAREMGYRPNARARAFSRRRTHAVGLLYTDDAWIFEGVNTLVLNSLVRALQQRGYHLVFAPIDESDSWEEVVLGGQIDGGVVFQPLSDSVREVLNREGLPQVLLGDSSDPQVSRVFVDDYSGAYAAAKHLIGLGHRRLLFFVHHSVKPHCSIAERRRGFEAALSDSGLGVGRYVQGGEQDAVDLLVHGDERPTGVICYSDLESTLMMHAMWQIGVLVPNQLSLIGFNDVFSTTYMTPPLTTVAFDACRIGEVGARMILDQIEGQVDLDQPRVEVIKPRLVVRGSTSRVGLAGQPPVSEERVGTIPSRPIAHNSTIVPGGSGDAGRGE